MKLSEFFNDLSTIFFKHGDLDLKFKIFHPECPINNETVAKEGTLLLPIDTDEIIENVHLGNGNKKERVTPATQLTIVIECK